MSSYAMSPKALRFTVGGFSTLVVAFLVNAHLMQGTRSDPAVEAELASQGPAEAPAVGPRDPTRSVFTELASQGYWRAVGASVLPASAGVLDRQARAAIMAWEFDHGHAITGEPSEALLKAMLFRVRGKPSDAGQQTPITGNAFEIVQAVQRSLRGLGYLGRGRDGRLDGPTRQAILAFERDQGLSPSGRVSAPLLAALTKVEGRFKAASRD